jgi:hypothetical protein
MELGNTDQIRFAQAVGAAQALFKTTSIPRIPLEKLVSQLRTKLLEVRAMSREVLEAAHRGLDAEDDHNDENLVKAVAAMELYLEQMNVLSKVATMAFANGRLRKWPGLVSIWRDIEIAAAEIDEAREIMTESLSPGFCRDLAESKKAAELQINS